MIFPRPRYHGTPLGAIRRLVGVSRGQPGSPDRARDGDLLEARNERFASRYRVLHGGQRQGRVVTGHAVPNFRYPDRIVVSSVFGHHVAETTWHIGCARLQDLDHFIAPAREKRYLCNQSPHAARLL
jgi:hypothetical protein